MKVINLLKPTDVCKGCEGTRLQIQDSGPLRGMIRICPFCARDWKTLANKYGTDQQEHQSVYVDMEQGLVANIDPKKKYILGIDGKEIPLN